LRARVVGSAVAIALIAGAGASTMAANAKKKAAVADDETIAHVLNRVGFGPAPGQIAEVRQMGLDAYIEQQLYPQRIPDPDMNGRLASFPTLEMSAGTIAQQYYQPLLDMRQEIQKLRNAQQNNEVAAPAGTMTGQLGEAVPLPTPPAWANKRSAPAPAAAKTNATNTGTAANAGAPANASATGNANAAANAGGGANAMAPASSMTPATATAMPAPPVAGSDDDLQARVPEETRKAFQEARRKNQAVMEELTRQKLLRAVYSDRQLEEVLVDFWFNHFNVFAGKGATQVYLTEYERDVIRPHVFGKFRDLLGATAHSPAMLFYLDNWQSVDPDAAERLKQEQQRRRELQQARRAAAQREPPMVVYGPNGRPRLAPRMLPTPPSFIPTTPPPAQPRPQTPPAQAAPAPSGQVPQPTQQAQAGQSGQAAQPQGAQAGQPGSTSQPAQTAQAGQPGQAPQQAQAQAPAQPQPPKPKPRPAGLNENYGRELLELHTLGVDGGYTQQDVIAVAKCFTGWTIRQPREGGGFMFDERKHTPGTKIVLGHKIDAGGERDGEAVLDFLAKQPATARFIVSKLVRRFVSDEPPKALVARATQRFLKTDGDLREVMRTILTSPEFLSVDARRAKVKTPFEFVASALRSTGAQIQDAQAAVRAIAGMGMPLYMALPPTGYVDRADAWVNTGALLNRMNFALTLVSNKVKGVQIDIGSLTGSQDVAIVRNRLLATLLGDHVSDATRAMVEKGTAAPQVAALTLGSPEFQRR
jgi:uncharacterized protein (DUF1800 family)